MAAAPGAGGITATTYNDDSILQALRRLQPDDLIKHMLETEEWSERLTKQCGARSHSAGTGRVACRCLNQRTSGAGEELARAAALNLFEPPEDGAQGKLELEAAASSVAALAGPLHVAPQKSEVSSAHLLHQTMQALAQRSGQQTVHDQQVPAAGIGNPPAYPY